MAGISEWEPGATSDRSLSCLHPEQLTLGRSESQQTSAKAAAALCRLPGPGSTPEDPGKPRYIFEQLLGLLPPPLPFFLPRAGLDYKGKPHQGPLLISGPGLGMKPVFSWCRQGVDLALSLGQPLYPGSNIWFFLTFVGLADSNPGLLSQICPLSTV